MDCSITVRRGSTADGAVHMRQIRGPARLVRSTWRMFAELESVRSKRLNAPTSRPGMRHRATGRVLNRFRAGGFLQAQSLSVGRPATAAAPRWPRRHGRLGSRPASPATACRSRVLTRHLVRAVGGSPTISRAATCERWRRTARRPTSTPRSSALSTSGRPRCPAGRGAKACSGVPLRARVEAPQMPRNRVVDDVQTACKRSVNAVQTDQARGVREPDTQCHDGRST
jgi:hypothetical protein